MVLVMPMFGEGRGEVEPVKKMRKRPLKYEDKDGVCEAKWTKHFKRKELKLQRELRGKKRVVRQMDINNRKKGYERWELTSGFSVVELTGKLHKSKVILF